MIEIDSSTGEGGGQILRTALSLSCILQKPVKFTNIRAKRPKPGLQAQHLTCVKALKEICSAEVKGAELGSSLLEFIPSKIKSGKYFFDIGTAGSITLLAQCVLPVLLFASEKSEVTFVGGTHVSFSPPADYFYKVFLPTIRKIGADAEFTVNRLGWFPVGGGKATLLIKPSSLKSIELTKREREPRVEVCSFYSNLPEDVGVRQLNSASLLVGNCRKIIERKEALCPGSCVFIRADYGNCVAGFSSLGARGKRAEAVGKEAGEEFVSFNNGSACVDEHLADQLLLYAALAKEQSTFTVEKISQHFETNVWTISRFLERKIEVEKRKEVIKVSL